MKNIVLFSALFIFACSGSTTSENKIVPPEYTVINAKSIDILQINKDSQGYFILFDGTSTNGWRGYGKTYLPPKWNIYDSCLHLSQIEEDGGDIIFEYNFKNFDLELEWKISKAGNSGIFYLAKEIKAKDPITDELNLQPIYVSAPEYQLIDNENHPDAKLSTNSKRTAGSLYDMIAAEPQMAKPAGEWNHTRITIKNGNVTHWMNGVKVLEYTIVGQSWIDLLNSGKFGQTKWPLAFELMKNCSDQKHQGYIGLQDFGYEVWYKNIKIKIIDNQ